MKVVYIKNISKTISAGDIKEVADGYAQNFLLPKGLALPATEENINKVKSGKKRKEKESVLSLVKTEKLAKQLDGLEINFKENANEKGTLFAAISEKELCRGLEKMNIKVNPKNLKLKQHIKEIGQHEVVVELNHGLEARVNVSVISNQ
ncbi:MAG: 50S ribosomal protein L9 [bacterium]